LKVNDENSRIRIQDLDPDPLVRSMDPRIRIRIHPKMSWIRNTVLLIFKIGPGPNPSGSTTLIYVQYRIEAKDTVKWKLKKILIPGGRSDILASPDMSMLKKLVNIKYIYGKR
jgi:hypothetical protein